MQKKIVSRSLLCSILIFAYIAFIAGLLGNVQKLFGPANNMLSRIAFLLLLVLSAAITGGLIFGQPAILYLNGQKKEGVQMIFYTLGFLALFAVVVLSLMLLGTKQ